MGTGSYQFDATNKLIKILSGSQNPLDALDIYTKSMDWADNSGSMTYDVPMRATGKAPLGGGAYSDSIFILQSGSTSGVWKLKFYDGNYQFTITGTIITEDETARTVSPDSGSVEVIFQVSSQGIQLPGAGLTESDKTDISTRVWTNTSGSSVSTRVDFLNQYHGQRWKITGSQLIMYNDIGQELKRFNLFNKQGQPTEIQIYERVPV